MNISIKREQSQTGLSFAERENQRSTAEGKVKFRPQVKKILFLLVLLCAMTTQRAWADQEYITDVAVIGANSQIALRWTNDEYVSKGYLIYDEDLNDGAGGHFINLLLKTNKCNGSDGIPITDFYILVSNNLDTRESITVNGRTYLRAVYDGDSEFKKSHGDLNCGADGKFIYLFYCKEENPVVRVDGIIINNEKYNPNIAVGKNGTSEPCDLNENAGGDYIYLHAIKSLVSSNADVCNESQLKEALAYNNINIRLTADITLNERMYISDGKTFTLDLNGHTLKRNLKENDWYNMVIHNYGTLTVNDGSGTNNGVISGGRSHGGGGIYCEDGSKLTLNGGTITDNHVTTRDGAGGLGGGIFLKNGAEATINGGVIKGNSAAKGGGIYNEGTLYMQGNPVIRGNNNNTETEDVYLPSGKVINVTGAFTAGTYIGICPSGIDAVVTSGYGTHNAGTDPSTVIFSNLFLSTLFQNEDGEVEIKQSQNLPTGNWIDYRAESFSNVNGDTIAITSAAEFALMAYNVNTGTDYQGTTFVLNTDLDMSAHYWTPIGNGDHPFKGNFSGKGHTINGVYVIRPSDDYNGLFGYVLGTYPADGSYHDGCGFIANLVLKNSFIKGGNYSGGVAGYLAYGLTMDNVVCQADVTGGSNVGGIVGMAAAPSSNYESHIRNCLLLSGTITGIRNHAAVIGNIGRGVHRSNLYYVSPSSDVGNDYDVRAFPVTKSISDGVTFDYNNGSTGVTYNDVLYYPAGTLNFSVAYPLTPTESISVAVNGTQLGNQVGDYQFAVSPETASYTIYVMVNSSGITGDGSVDNPYVISTAAQWDICAAMVGNGTSFSGEYFKLGNSITVSSMMGTDYDHPFSGTFDGDGKTLTLAYGGAGNYLNQECGAFYRLDNATIKNLTIAGHIYSSAQHCGGLAVKATGENNHIENCVSSVSINSNRNGDCSNGGFIGLLNTENTHVWFNGCAFTGELVGANASDWGGFVGWRHFRGDGFDNWNHNYVTFTDCLFAPTKVNISDGGNSRTFCRSYNNTTDGAGYNNSYYATVLQNVDGGRQMYSITAGTGVTSLENAGTVTTYSVSGITGYGTGIKYNGVLYGGNGDNVSLNLSGSATNHYICGETALLGHENPYTLRMPNADAVVSAWNVAAPTEIAVLDDWNAFCTAVSHDYDYHGETVTMTANVGNISTVAGDNDHPFLGTFDGGGHTLTLAFGSSDNYTDQKCAPFYRLDNATVKNLVVAGSIYSSAQNNAGIAVKATGSNIHIQNCVSNVSINSNIDGDCTNGGFIGILTTNKSYAYFDGCAFTGELLGANATNWGGFIGWRDWTEGNSCWVYFTDCLFAPTTINIKTEGGNSRTFCRSTNNDPNGTYTPNSYYSQALQFAERGEQCYAITAGTGVTSLENAGTVTTYSVSGITGYGTGIKYNGVLYGGNGDNVSLNITGTSPSGRYIANDQLLAGGSNPYTLTMGAADAEVSAWTFVPPTEIADLGNWEDFCTAVNNGYDYAGMTVTMTANVGTDANPADTIAGTYDYPFRGTFDGGGHTLTIGYGSSSSYSNRECAPFYRLNNATIKNLVVAGHIYSSAQHNGGIAARAYGDNNHIENCVSNVSIHSNRSGSGDADDCTNGGFIGLLNTDDTHVYFNGCAFTGELLGTETRNWGGFVGWREYYTQGYLPQWNRNYAHFTNCLFAPTTVDIATPEGSNSRPFCRSYNTDGASYSNCYYTNALQGDFGGKQAYSTATLPANIGEAGTDYGMIAAYANGLKCGERYYMAPEAVSLANDAANSTILSGKNGYFATVTLTDRTLYKDGNWNTLCLPFDLALEGSALDGAEARTLSEATFNAGTLTLNFSEPVSELTAGTPYILRWKDASADLVSPVFSGVTINATASTGITPGLISGTTGDGCVTFCGIYDPVEISPEGDNTKLYFSTGNTLYWPNGAMTINPFRAYLQLNGTAAQTRSIVLNIGGETTSISLTPDPSPVGEGSDDWYDMGGRKLDGKPAQPGIYIHAGRKVMIK